MTVPPRATQSLLLIHAQPWPWQLLWPLQELSGVAQAEEPLQALTPEHLTVACSPGQSEEQPDANKAAAAAASARPTVLDVRFIRNTPDIN